MANKFLRMAVWMLDETLDLEQISKLLELDYNSTIPYLEDADLMPHEKTLDNHWSEYYQGNGFEQHEIEILDTKIKCLPAYAVYEVPDPERDAVYEGGEYIVPRARRVTKHTQPVFFFENYGRVYAIVVGPVSSDGRIRSNLMGGKRPKDPRHTGWKKVLSSEVRNYTLPSELLYWLISKQNSIVETSFVHIGVSDIRYLAQSTERNDAKYMSEGSNLLDEAVPRTGLGVNSLIGQVGTTLIIQGEANLRLIIRETGECIIDTDFSVVHGKSDDFETIEDNLERAAMLLYMLILPGLRSAYNGDVNSGAWTSQHESDARKQWALGAIAELCEANNINLDEIKNMDVFKMMTE